LPGLLDGLGPELALGFGSGVRLGRQQLGVQVSGIPAITWWPAQPGAIRGFALTNCRSYGLRSTVWPGSNPNALAPGPHHRPGGSPPVSLAWM